MTAVLSRLARFARKDLLWHWPALLALGATLPVMFLLLLVSVAVNPQTITHLEAHRLFLDGVVTLAAMALANRLVVAEYYGRTQLFLEALPIRRLEPLAVKYVLGLLALALAAGPSLVVSALVALRTEPVGARFFALIAVRTGFFLTFAWSGFFAMGLLGRLRIPLYTFAFGALAVLDATTDFEITRFGPFALVGQQMVLDRTGIPWRELAWTTGFTLAWLGLAVGLATVREGSLTESLSRPMTAREKVTAAVILFGWMIAESQLGSRKTKAPLRFEGPCVARAAQGDIEVQYNRPAAADRAAVLLGDLERDLRDLHQTLGGRAMPPVRVALRESLDGVTFEPVVLNTADGVLVRANFMAPEGTADAALRAVVLAQVLDHRSHGRARFERQRWLRDGFARWWVCRDRADGCARLPARALLASGQTPPRAETLLRWTPTRETLGGPMSEALAWSALDAMNDPRAVRALARRVFGREAPDDVREVLHTRAFPIEREVREATGRPWEDFVRAWATRLDGWGRDPALRAVVAPYAAIRAAWTVEPHAGDQRTVGFVLTAVPPEVTRVALVHLDRGPFERPIVETDLQREETALRVGSDGFSLTVAGRYTRFARVFAAVELDAPPLGCALRLGARRLALP